MRHDGVREILGAQTVASLEMQLSQAWTPQIEYSSDGNGVAILDTGRPDGKLFPLVAMRMNETIAFPTQLTTQPDEAICRQIAAICGSNPELTEFDAFGGLYQCEMKRRAKATQREVIDRACNAMLVVHHHCMKIGGTAYYLTQLPVACLMMDDVLGNHYQSTHPIVTLHEATHLGDYYNDPAYAESDATPMEFRLRSELHAHHISALSEYALDHYGICADGLWNRATFPGRSTISSRVEAVRKQHTQPDSPYGFYPSIYLGLEQAGLSDVY